jgi:hypothetical protein
MTQSLTPSFEKLNDTTYVLKNVPLIYSSLSKVNENKNEDGSIRRYWEGKAVIPEDIADEIELADFVKPKARKVVLGEADKSFQERYGFDLPSFATAKKHYTLSVRQKCEFTDRKTGQTVQFTDDMNARPKAYMKDPDDETKLLNITDKFLPNGSIGDLIISTYQTKNGVFGRLQGIMIHELAEATERPQNTYQDPFAMYGSVPVTPRQEKPQQAPSAPDEVPNFDDDDEALF